MTTPPTSAISLTNSILRAAPLALAAALTLAACEQSTTPPPAPTTTGNSGGGGPLSNLSQNPTSLPGRSAATGKNAARQISQEQARAVGAAQEITGEAAPVDVAGLVFSAPSAWEKVSPSPTRAAEFKVGDAGEGNVAFFYFANGGGTVAQNVDRWKTMVLDAAGNPADAEVTNRRVNGMNATLVSMEGTYQDGMPGQPKTPRPGYAFRGAIIEGPQGNVFIRFTGPKAVVEAAEAEWTGMVEGTRKK